MFAFAPGLTAAQLPTACGACIVWPSLATSTALYGGLTDADGAASLNLPLPAAEAGLQFTTQWAVVVPGPNCAACGVDLSLASQRTVP